VFNKDDQQVGFARIVTDYAVLAWVMDVFIAEDYRGKGLSKLLMKEIMEHPDLQGLKRWGLMTADAHSLYQQFGFSSASKPEMLMEKLL
jgi:GNAT superfamily N-acetyltransferase